MEKRILDLRSKEQISDYRKNNCLIRYEPLILDEIQEAAEKGDLKKLDWFDLFGKSFRSIIMNVNAYRKGLEFGFEDILLDKYDWLVRPAFSEIEDLIFGNEERYGEHSVLHIGRGQLPVWTYALNYNYGTAGGGSALSVHGKRFRSRDEAFSAGLSELKALMTAKLNHDDTTNFKQSVIAATLKDITKAEIGRVQLTIF